MGIKIKCPNGHELNVKEKYAGKTGLCPQCQAEVQVPTPGAISDDEIIAILGRPPAMKPNYPPPAEESVLDAPKPPESEEKSSGISLLGSSFVRRKKVCPKCCHLVSYAFKQCPRCGNPLDVAWEVSPNTEPKKQR